jgi:hypothetical protein
MTRVISVFGGSTPRPGMPSYDNAYAVGKLLVESGYAVATGGYSGTMLAVSQGAAEAGGHVIGVTSAQIERFRPLGPNQFVAEEIKYESLRERLLHLVTDNDGMIVLPGGIGTLSEAALAWSFLQTGEITPRPLVLLGAIWRTTLEAFITPDYIHPDHSALLNYALTPEEAVSLVRAAHA